MRDWKKVVGEQSSRPQRGVPRPTAAHEPGPSSPPAPGPSSSGESEVPGAESEDEVRDSIDPSSDDDDDQADTARLCREGESLSNASFSPRLSLNYRRHDHPSKSGHTETS
jgi:hypothetical protein